MAAQPISRQSTASASHASVSEQQSRHAASHATAAGHNLASHTASGSADAASLATAAAGVQAGKTGLTQTSAPAAAAETADSHSSNQSLVGAADRPLSSFRQLSAPGMLSAVYSPLRRGQPQQSLAFAAAPSTPTGVVANTPVGGAQESDVYSPLHRGQSQQALAAAGRAAAEPLHDVSSGAVTGFAMHFRLFREQIVCASNCPCSEVLLQSTCND